MKGGELMKKILQAVSTLPALLIGWTVASRAQAEASVDFPTTFAGLSSQDIKVTIGNIVQIVLGFLGILTVLIILLGGFKWMTSGGNEEKIDEAKKLISAGVVGLVIVLAAYAIAGFIVNNLANAV